MRTVLVLLALSVVACPKPPSSEVGFGSPCPDGECPGLLVCANGVCTGANFIGTCDPNGVIPEATCPAGTTCVISGFSDEGPAASSSCQRSCFDDQAEDDGCGPDQACVGFGCTGAFVCRDPGTNADCDNGGEGEPETNAGGTPGEVCVDDGGCGGGVCGAYHRCFLDECSSNGDCESGTGCATASLENNTCGSGCVQFVELNGPCRFVSASDCDNVAPCGPGLACDQATGTCLRSRKFAPPP